MSDKKMSEQVKTSQVKTRSIGKGIVATTKITPGGDKITYFHRTTTNKVPK